MLLSSAQYIIYLSLKFLSEAAECALGHLLNTVASSPGPIPSFINVAHCKALQRATLIKLGIGPGDEATILCVCFCLHLSS